MRIKKINVQLKAICPILIRRLVGGRVGYTLKYTAIYRIPIYVV